MGNGNSLVDGEIPHAASQEDGRQQALLVAHCFPEVYSRSTLIWNKVSGQVGWDGKRSGSEKYRDSYLSAGKPKDTLYISTINQ